MALTSSRAVASRRTISGTSRGRRAWKRRGRHQSPQPRLGGADLERAGPAPGTGRGHDGGGAAACSRAVPTPRGGGEARASSGRRVVSGRAARVAVLPSADGRGRQGRRLRLALSLRPRCGRRRAEARLRANGRVRRRAEAVDALSMLCRAACR